MPIGNLERELRADLDRLRRHIAHVAEIRDAQPHLTPAEADRLACWLFGMPRLHDEDPDGPYGNVVYFETRRTSRPTLVERVFDALATLCETAVETWKSLNQRGAGEPRARGKERALDERTPEERGRAAVVAVKGLVDFLRSTTPRTPADVDRRARYLETVWKALDAHEVPDRAERIQPALDQFAVDASPGRDARQDPTLGTHVAQHWARLKALVAGSRS